MTHTDGGPAFPRPFSEQSPPDLYHESRPSHQAQDGISKRDYFAAAALTGFLANHINYKDLSRVAKDSYRMADAMLRERSGEPEGEQA